MVIVCLRFIGTERSPQDLMDREEMGKETNRYLFREVFVDVEECTDILASTGGRPARGWGIFLIKRIEWSRAAVLGPFTAAKWSGRTFITMLKDTYTTQTGK